MTRTEAARLIEALRMVATVEPTVRLALEHNGVPALTPCDGEAHTNPHVDNCNRCAPRWGWCGEKVVVR